MTIFLPDEAATMALGRHLLEVLPEDLGGWTLLLEGELGAGKSTLARSLIRAAGHEGAVPSPTYTLVEPYTLSRGKLYHIDLYRVVNEEELDFLGFDELDDGCRLVEWPDRAPGLDDVSDLRVTLTYADSGRAADLAGLSDRGRALAERLEAIYRQD
ncbi:MAG TPA: tRNA (adenosine(37)-N6)-threonylcarbamoyltransferase complex ATPase subunit type 1 TsaE [Woeseiaceae bacterium]